MREGRGAGTALVPWQNESRGEASGWRCRQQRGRERERNKKLRWALRGSVLWRPWPFSARRRERGRRPGRKAKPNAARADADAGRGRWSRDFLGLFVLATSTSLAPSAPFPFFRPLATDRGARAEQARTINRRRCSVGAKGREQRRREEGKTRKRKKKKNSGSREADALCCAAGRASTLSAARCRAQRAGDGKGEDGARFFATGREAKKKRGRVVEKRFAPRIALAFASACPRPRGRGAREKGGVASARLETRAEAAGERKGEREGERKRQENVAPLSGGKRLLPLSLGKKQPAQ